MLHRSRVAHGTTARRAPGFTLVEMMAVILIMALLIGVGVSMLGKAKDNARATITRDTAKQIAESWGLYLNQNAGWPAVIPATAETEPVHSMQTNLVAGFELKEEEKVSGLRDSWGSLYSLWFDIGDTGYDGQIEHPYESGTFIKAPIVVISPGKDKSLGTRDDIVVY